jgi:hypothetical protein
MDPLQEIDEFKGLVRTIFLFIHTSEMNRTSDDYWSIEELEDALIDT